MMTSNFPLRYQGVPIHHCIIKGPHCDWSCQRNKVMKYGKRPRRIRCPWAPNVLATPLSLIQSRRTPQNPRCCNFRRRRSWGTWSKALEKSSKMASTCSLSQRPSARSFTVSRSWDSQDLFLRTHRISSCFLLLTSLSAN